jgi:hypothetical protein
MAESCIFRGCSWLGLKVHTDRTRFDNATRIFSF